MKKKKKKAMDLGGKKSLSGSKAEALHCQREVARRCLVFSTIVHYNTLEPEVE